MTTIRTLMHAPVVSVSAEASIQEVARRMRQESVGVVLVVEKDRVVGIFSERDLLTRVVAEGLDPIETRAEQVATREVLSVPLDARIRDCAALLRERGVRHLPVIEDGRPVGIISARDFFDAIAGGFEGIIENVQYREQLRENTDPYDHLGGSYGR